MVCEPMQNAVCEILVRIVRSSPHISWGWDLVWRRGNNPHTITEFYLTTSPPTILPSLPESHTTKQTQCGGILLTTLHLIWALGEWGFAFSLSILAVNANNAPRKILATHWQGATLQGAKIILAFGSPVDPRTSQLHHVQGWARHRYFWHAPPYYGGDRYL